LVGIDAVVDSYQQICASAREPMDLICAQAVTFIAVREVSSRRGSQAAKDATQDVRAKHAVAVIVAMDGDSLLRPDASIHSIDGLLQARDRQRIGKSAPGWSLDKGINVFDSASDEDV
jgi:hypothetical protein